MRMGLHIVWVLMWVLIMLGAWHLWSQKTLRLEAAWVRDHRQVVCGRQAAMRQNLESAQEMAVALRPDLGASIQEGVAEANEFWAEVFEANAQSCSGPASDGYELYGQTNPSLSPLYPNWWIRWREIAR